MRRFLPLAALALATSAAAENAPPKDNPSAAPAARQAPDPLEAIKAETAKLVAQREKIAAQMALEQSQLDEKLAPRRHALAELQIQLEEIKVKMELAESGRRAKDDPGLVDLRRKNEKLMLEYALEKNQTDIDGFQMKRDENAIRRKTSELSLQMELQQKEAEARTYAVGKSPAYSKEPLAGRKLVLSDRTIQLNGVISQRTADSLADRIAYFNNRDGDAPIFIVIDDCPGGSVMAGYKILKAMQGSRAPVYTVVKSFAASMAACITTLSKKSFAYPNALILHHQLSVGVMGNLTQHRENVKELEEWWKRLAGPVAEKMGISREEFIERMYKKSSTGDWSEFADDAQKLKWVDVIVEEIEETALLRHPDAMQAGQTGQPGVAPRITPGPPTTELSEGQDDRGRPVMLLPRLNPLDAYWLYNPDGYYRMQ